ncbi:uncharacterized protein N7503_008210 [Penicillium pulvis]|uniref:uncharacterized protein n=1 Tax=Penicillium pulvis TaxID=1562058 RepID=UPI0025485198|nr:uncharacterized protein N7503_008210 [Penicillium pulvis]KAJ5792232.1 hypothetical protein N7503_008210 [Penicillium pulvis]
MILPTINAGAPPDFGVMFSLHLDPEPLLPAHHFKSSKLLIAAWKILPAISLVEAAPQKITTSPEPPIDVPRFKWNVFWRLGFIYPVQTSDLSIHPELNPPDT